ncbi:hypothetical protein EPUS_00374 [Endocarpon pusillum Z07020]|uniref:Uncharacterized protein n=1 Tax=Endocarpon pusillum (strain Z07020 / HMAS-L-300199) TaxID=1263415 RepID=U1GEP3_ENDPU|nr:uncharacterized protein EPUS_00374 [Endocarpon pusillum Z07020]ERF70186.1 hypothetical protein EPUS_00374 [Endocarpon pusillum Z07020]
MAAPPKVTIDDLSGKFVMNRNLSDPIDPILTLQGLSWFLRKAISFATVTLSVHQYRKPASEEPKQPIHIDITQRATGGISTTQENRVLDWSERDHEDRIFGKVKGKSRMFEGFGGGENGFKMEGKGGEVDERFLKGDVDKDGKTESEKAAGTEAEGAEGDKTTQQEGEGTTSTATAATTSGWLDENSARHVQSWVVNVDETAAGGWTAEQVWGFEMFDQKRYYTRRVVVRKGEDKVERARLVYDYKGEVDMEAEKAEDGKKAAAEELEVEY